MINLFDIQKHRFFLFLKVIQFQFFFVNKDPKKKSFSFINGKG
jgi:hypothetical protein